MNRTNGIRMILLVAAIVCFVLATFGVSWLGLSFVPLGLAFFVASFLEF